LTHMVLISFGSKVFLKHIIEQTWPFNNKWQFGQINFQFYYLVYQRPIQWNLNLVINNHIVFTQTFWRNIHLLWKLNSYMLHWRYYSKILSIRQKLNFAFDDELKCVQAYEGCQLTVNKFSVVILECCAFQCHFFSWGSVLWSSPTTSTIASIAYKLVSIVFVNTFSLYVHTSFKSIITILFIFGLNSNCFKIVHDQKS
jgi:hypothetical protein